MAFYHFRHPYNPGYAVPDYVLAEPPGRGTFTTAWLPRGTISQVIPDYLAKPGRKLLGRDNAGLGGLGSLADTTLDGSTLGGGHSLSTPTLAGDTLGVRKYTLESLGADAAKRAAFYEPQGESSLGGILTNPWAWAFGLGAYLWWSSSKKSKGGGGGGSNSVSLGSYSKGHFKTKKKASTGGYGSLSEAERERRAGLMQNPRRRRRARRARR